MLPTRNYTVEGMTCGHCRKAVIEEVLQVEGVKGVDVDLDSGRVTVAGESFADDAIAQAIDEAGYTLVS
jgi:copper chaperone